LKEGETMSVEDLLKSICIASANDAMVAMAEQISGTQEAFVERMNEKAQELKLSNTHFTNASGLHDPQHYSCASDMACIASALLQEGGEELLAITGTYDAYIREDSAQKFWLVNTNKLIRQMQGADGLKTGYTDQAGSCITATACRNSLRLIAVVMHEPDSATRNQETIQLLEYGFSRYEQKQLYAAGDEVDTLTIEKGDPSRVGLIAREDAYFMYEKGKESKVSSTKIELVKKELPYDPKDTVARAHVKMSDGYTFTVDLGVKEAVRPMSFLQLWIRALREMFA
ncbi:MAG: D-alanyl-D-alanine carboxypeptidase family protein, partial [Merdibacter sp.]|nr:D-alanyl-D-alanine carboxypeptidase family protein [Merdibacter sp.]